MKQRVCIGFLFSLSLIAPFALPAAAQQVDLNRITGISVKTEGGAMKVEIEGSKPVSFTNFKLSDPPRVVIDVAEAQLEGVPENTPVNNGIISEIAASQHGIEATSIARLIISFEKEVEYTVISSGNNLVMRMEGGAPAAVAAAEPAAAPLSEETGMAEIEEVEVSETVPLPAERPADVQPPAVTPEAVASAAPVEQPAEPQPPIVAAVPEPAHAPAEEESPFTMSEVAQPPAAVGSAPPLPAPVEAETPPVPEVPAPGAPPPPVDEAPPAFAEKVEPESRSLSDAFAPRISIPEPPVPPPPAAPEVAEAAPPPPVVEESPFIEESSKAFPSLPAAEAASAPPVEESLPALPSVMEEPAAAAPPPVVEEAPPYFAMKEEPASPPLSSAFIPNIPTPEPPLPEIDEAPPPPLPVDEPPAASAVFVEKFPQQPPVEPAPYVPAESRPLSMTAEPSQPAAEAAMVYNPPSSVEAKVTWVGFKQMKDFSRVFVKTNEKALYSIREAGQDLLVLELQNARIPQANNRRFLDTSAFESAVAMIAPKEIKNYPPIVQIEIKLKQKVAYEARQEQNLVVVDFQRTGEELEEIESMVEEAQEPVESP